MVATREFNERATRSVVLALPESAIISATTERLQRSGWRVYRAASLSAVRRLACRHEPDAVVLSVDGAEESGWLTCAKLMRGSPELRVIMVGESTPANRAIARFTGAEALLPTDVTAENLADRVAQLVFV